MLAITAFIVGVIVIPFWVEGATAQQEITILFTHDLHDNLYPFRIEEDGESNEVGGYARLATVIENEQKRYDQTVLVDAGDFSMGTLFQTIFATKAPTLRLMGQFGYDAVTLGNHEFDFRAAGLANSLRAAKESGDAVPPVVSSNIVYPLQEDGTMDPEVSSLKEAMDAYGVTPYRVIERNGIKVGIFGLLGEDAVSNAPMAGVTFDPIVESSKEIVEQLKTKEQVDLIIALSHSGTSEDKKTSEDEELAKQVPEIDVIVSGHTHTFLEEPIVVKDTVIGSTGEYGQNLGVLTLKQKENERWDVVEYELKRIDDEIEKDEEVVDKIEAFKQAIQTEYLDYFEKEFDQVLGVTPFTLTDFSMMYERHAEDPLGNLIGDAYMATVREHDDQDAEPITAAVVPVGTIRNSLYEGNITVSDVFNVSSLGIGPDQVSGYPLIEVYVTGKELKTIAEVDASVSPLMPSAQLYIAGLSYTFNPNRIIFNKVTDVNIARQDGTLDTIVDDKMYRLVTGLYSGQMLPIVSEKSFGLLSIEPKQKDGSPITNFEDHIMYMNDGSNRELKEWYAIANYIASFEVKDQLPEVPDYYAQTHSRKKIDDSKHIASLIKNPNGIALTIYAIGLVVILGIVSVTRLIIRKRRSKQLHKAS